MEEDVKGEGVMQCSEENVAEFNVLLRAELPEFYALAKALHARGMIDGLRGARIGPVGSLGGDCVPAALSNAAEARLAAKRRAKGLGS